MSTQTIDQVIHARWVLPIAPENTVLEHHSVAIDGGRIVAVLPTQEAKTRFETKETMTLNDHALLPGFVNAHTHNPMTLFRGLADDLALMDWLENHIWPAEQALIKPESILDGTNLAIAEMIRGGTTCFSEHYFFPEETAEAAIKSGMRACVGLHLMNIPTLWAKDENEGLAKARTVYERRTKNSRLMWAMAPHSPYTLTPEGLQALHAQAEEWDIPVHIHLHESQNELDISLKAHGKRPIACFDDWGLLSKRLIAVHMVHLKPEEMALIADRGVSVVHCPESNLKLASGMAPVYAMQQAGINVAMGTDGSASNNDLDMLGEARTAAFLAKAVANDPTALDALTTLKMATLNGAKALGWDHEIGSLETGKAADMIAIDLNALNTQPVYHPASAILYAASSQQVSDVWVEGRALLKNKALTTLDANAVMARAEVWRDRAKSFS